MNTETEQEAIDTAPDGRIDAARVQFYTAEIILALVHLHDLGLMYRDLKVQLNDELRISPCTYYLVPTALFSQQLTKAKTKDGRRFT